MQAAGLSQRKPFFILIICLLLYSFPWQELKAIGSAAGRDTTRAHACYVAGMEQLKEGSYREAMDLFDEASRDFRKRKQWERAVECDLRKTDAWSSLPDREGLIEFWQETLRLSEEKLGPDQPLTGRCHKRLGELYYLDDRHEEARKSFHNAMEICRRNDEKESLDIAEIYINYGRVNIAVSAYDSVECYLDKARSIQLASLDTLDTRMSLLYHTYGVFYYHVGKMDQSIYYNRLVLQIEQKQYGEMHPDVAKAYNNLGASYIRKGEFNLALEAHQHALQIRLETLDTLNPNVALSYNNLGNVYTSLGDYKKSDECQHIALRYRRQIFDENHRDIAMSYANLGNNQLQQGNYQEAQEYFRKVVPIMEYNYGPDHMLTTDAIENAGVPFYYMGRLDSAFHYFYRALIVREDIQGGMNIKVARSYNNIGAIYKENRDYDLALSYYLKSMELYTSLLGEQSYPLSGSCNNIGEVYYLKGDYNSSLEYYQKALEIDEKHLGADNSKLAGRLLNLGSLYTDLGNYDEAFEAYKKTLRLQSDAYGERTRLASSVYSNMAMIYSEMDSVEKAISLMSLAIDIREDISGTSDPELAADYTAMGIFQAKEGNITEGAEYLQKGLIVNYHGQLDLACLQKCEPDQMKDINQFIETLVTMAGFNNRYLPLKDREKTLVRNLEIYDFITDLTILLRHRYRFENAKLQALQQWDYLYAEAFETAASLYDLTGDELYFDRAFEFSGLKKASALSDAIVTSEAMLQVGIPDSIIQQERKLSSSLEDLKRTLMETEEESGSPEDISELEQLINSTTIALNDLYLSIEREYPEYDNLVSGHTGCTPSDVAGLLDPGTLLIDFVVTDTTLYTVLIGNTEKAIVKTSIPADFGPTVQDLLRAVKKYRITEFPTLSGEVYSYIIQPLEDYLEGKEKLVFIPERYLLLLPFDMLCKLDDSGESGYFPGLDYLIKHYETSSHYSVDLWFRSRRAGSMNPDDPELAGFIGFAPVFDSPDKAQSPDAVVADLTETTRDVVDRLSLHELPGSVREVDDIAALFNGKGLEASCRIRSDATEESFRKMAGNYRYVHLATHGLINPAKPELSGLVFWKDSTNNTPGIPELLVSARTDDGVLFTKEVYNLSMHADLVTLSACETGTGMMAKGEGLLSFVRGFSYSGVPNILITHWKIDDRSTAGFMHTFYHGILSGQSFSAALREAKLELIQDETSAFPSNWAAYTLIGAD